MKLTLQYKEIASMLDAIMRIDSEITNIERIDELLEYLQKESKRHLVIDNDDYDQTEDYMN